jgi:signal transduction histidine kinase/CheY-like chemotaxis protein
MANAVLRQPADPVDTIALERARLLGPALLAAMLGWSLAIELLGEPARWITVVNLGMCVVVAGTVIASRRHAPARWGHALLAAIWCAPVLATLNAEWIQPDPLYRMLLLLDILGAVALIETRWVIGIIGGLELVSALLGVRHDPRLAVSTILVTVTAGGFAVAFQVVMRRALLLQMRTADEMRVQLAERSRLEEQLLHAGRMEAVGTLAAGLAHDMNNVLASITSFASLLEDEVQTERGHADLDQITAQSLRGAELTRGLLAFSRRGQYRKQLIRVDDIVLEVLPMLVRTLPRSIEIRDQLAGAEHCVEGDPIQLGQAVINLGLNAAHAMQARGVFTIATTVGAVQADEATRLGVAPGRYARIEVSDHGEGMDETTRARVFEPFFTTKAAGKGTGLGLSTVWGIVQAHGGTVTVTSVPGKGSAFTMYLPTVSATTEARAVPAIMRTQPLTRIGTVLVVDDEPAVRAGTTRIVERMGMSALQAANGQEALELFRESGPAINLVILDMGMPVMGGAECFRELRRLSEVPVLIATGYADDADVQAMVARGAVVIEKPFVSSDLMTEISRLITTTPRAT